MWLITSGPEKRTCSYNSRPPNLHVKDSHLPESSEPRCHRGSGGTKGLCEVPWKKNLATLPGPSASFISDLTRHPISVGRSTVPSLALELRTSDKKTLGIPVKVPSFP